MRTHDEGQRNLSLWKMSRMASEQRMEWLIRFLKGEKELRKNVLDMEQWYAQMHGVVKRRSETQSVKQ
jgi:hypothetical protein